MKKGIPYLDDGKILTFGIKPSRPETGYGYIETKSAERSEVLNIKKFIEKPVLEKAKMMASNKNFLWNSGVFLFKASDMISAYRKFAPETLELVEKSLSSGNNEKEFFDLSSNYWKVCKTQSIDYCIMEKAKNLMVVPYEDHWSDLGELAVGLAGVRKG